MITENPVVWKAFFQNYCVELAFSITCDHTNPWSFQQRLAETLKCIKTCGDIENVLCSYEIINDPNSNETYWQ